MVKFKKIYIEITNKCNLDCTFCSKDNLPLKDMNISEFEYIIKEINSYTDYLYLHVKGEPLLHPSLKQILNICKKYNKKVNITTNGTLLKQNAEILIESKIVRQINISLHSEHGSREKYLEQILDATKILLEKTDIQIVFRYWALSKNKLLKQYEDEIDVIMNYFSLPTFKKKEILEKDNITLCNHLYLNKEKRFIWPKDSKAEGEVGTCYGSRHHLAILVDGRVVPCCLDSTGIVTFGNIFHESFADIINSPRLIDMKTSFQNRKIKEPFCQKCTYRFKFKI